MLKPDQMMTAQAALAALDTRGPVWTALLAVLADERHEANYFATHPDTDEEKRMGWCFRERGLVDLAEELEAIRSGTWRNRAEYKEFFSKLKDTEEEAEE